MLRICSRGVLILGLALGAGAAGADVRGAARVIDGDTLNVAGTNVRLIGIDAPEMAQTCELPQGEWPCGVWARDVLEELVQGLLTCVGSETDRYGRLLARCDAGQGDLGARMVEAGAATAYRRYSRVYVQHEVRARDARRGVWRRDGRGLTDPAEFRATSRVADHVSRSSDTPPAGCEIKGNVSANGRIYHRPGQRDYDHTRIDVTRGERWFCSDAQALAAGWRPAAR